jgi:electron transfer flavoprotein beta subunit
VIELEGLALSEEELSPRTIIEELYLPPETEGAVILEGDPSKVADEIVRILTERGVNI